MENKQLLYNKLKDDIEKFIIEFKNETNSDPKILELLKGWIISYSNIIQDCKVLLIGINPGNGKEMDPFYFFEKNEDMPKLEYLNENENKYGLAKNINKFFRNANCEDILFEHTMKTNTKFYATTNETELIELENHLFLNYRQLFKKLKIKTIEWSKIFIEEIAQPKLIIAEGIRAYDFLYNDIYSNVKYVDLSTRNSIMPAWRNLENGMIYIGFRRDNRGNIPKFDAVSDEISKYLKNL